MSKKRTKQIKEEPLIHFIGASSHKSPCGDEDENSPLTDDIEHVTCQMCLYEIRNKHKGPQYTIH